MKTISSTNIEHFSNKNMIEYNKTLTTKALLNAKEKASFIVEYLWRKLGKVLSITNNNHNTEIFI